MALRDENWSCNNFITGKIHKFSWKSKNTHCKDSVSSYLIIHVEGLGAGGGGWGHLNGMHISCQWQLLASP